MSLTASLIVTSFLNKPDEPRTRISEPAFIKSGIVFLFTLPSTVIVVLGSFLF